MRAVVVDDSVVFRRVVSEALERIPGVQVVATASNGRQAVQRVIELKPDLVSLDIEMPELDGLQVLEALRDAHCDAGIIVLSGLTARASSLTVKALERGAFDFITKPAADSIEQSKDLVYEALRPRVNALARRREIQALLRKPGGTGACAQAAGRGAHAASRPPRSRSPAARAIPGRKPETGAGGRLDRRAERAGPALAGHPARHRRAHPDRAAHAAHVHGLAGREPGTQVPNPRARGARRRGAGAEHRLHRPRRAADADRQGGGGRCHPGHRRPSREQLPAGRGLPFPLGRQPLPREGHGRDPDRHGQRRCPRDCGCSSATAATSSPRTRQAVSCTACRAPRSKPVWWTPSCRSTRSPPALQPRSGEAFVMAVSLDELRVWSRYIYSVTGISLDDSKGYLVETRFAGPAARDRQRGLPPSSCTR